MNVVHVVSTFPPYHGGMGRVALEMVSALRKKEYEVSVVTPLYRRLSDFEALEFEETKEIARRIEPGFSFGNAAWLPTIGKELDTADVVHLHYPFFGTAHLVLRWKHRHPNRPLVVTYHMDARGPGWRGLFFRWYEVLYLPRILKASSAMTASSFDYLTQSMVAGDYARSPDLWHEVPFGVDTKRFRPREKQEQLFRRYELDPDVPIILFVGGMDEAHAFKGVSILLKALAILLRSRVDAQCLFVGEGNLRPRFEEEAGALGITQFVRFTGKVSDDELPFYYSLADLLVLPSINQSEAFGMVLLEAFASGIPVLATDIPGVRQVAAIGGAVVPPNDAMALAKGMSVFFAQSEEDRRALGLQARRVVEQKYTWERVGERLEKIYRQVVVAKMNDLMYTHRKIQ